MERSPDKGPGLASVVKSTARFALHAEKIRAHFHSDEVVFGEKIWRTEDFGDQNALLPMPLMVSNQNVARHLHDCLTPGAMSSFTPNVASEQSQTDLCSKGEISAPTLKLCNQKGKEPVCDQRCLLASSCWPGAKASVADQDFSIPECPTQCVELFVSDIKRRVIEPQSSFLLQAVGGARGTPVARCQAWCTAARTSVMPCLTCQAPPVRKKPLVEQHASRKASFVVFCFCLKASMAGARKAAIPPAR